MSLRKASTAVAAAHPLSEALRLLFTNNKKGRKQSLKAREVNPNQVDIVSERLCDDVINYLAPTLEPYRGCTIIDVNPGACLWSSKLHEHLKPKRHILMEPDERYIDPFIKPLLDRPESKYVHTSLYGTHNTGIFLQNFNLLLDDERFFPHRSPPAYDDPKLRQIDTSVLLTGNLVRRHAKTPRTWVNRANHTDEQNGVLLLQGHAALVNDSLHRFGLVRQLWWAPERAKVATIAYNQSFRSKLNSFLDLASDITEVAGVKPAVDYERRGTVAQKGAPRLRSPGLANASHKLVQERMHKAGINLPEGRKILPPSLTVTPTHYEIKDPYTIVHHTEADLNKAIDELRAHVDELASSRNFLTGIIKGGKKTCGLEDYIERLHYPQSIPMADEVLVIRTGGAQLPKDGVGAGTLRRALYIDMMLRILNLETHAVHLRDILGLDLTDIAARLHSIDKTAQGLQPTVNLQQANLHADQAAFFSRPQNLKYDRRLFEPLQISDTDVFPETNLTLLDVIPSTVDLDVPGLADRNEVAKLTEQFLKIIFSYRTASLPWILDRIAPNCAQDLIPQAPSVTDPRRGGRLNPENVLVRTVTEGMVRELVNAWYEWPFKPERFELELAGMQADVYAKTDISEPVEA